MESTRKGSDGFSGFRKSSASSSHRRGDANASTAEGSSMLPPSVKTRLHSLFHQLEKEFEAIYVENAQLREKVALLEKGQPDSLIDEREKFTTVTTDEPDAFETVFKTFTKKNAFKTRHKLKAHTSKIVSSFKAPQLTCSLVKEYKGHRDGIWDVSVSNLGHPLLATASADKTARIWGIDSGRCLLTYAGHSGSVNAVSFHPTQDLALTASGDGTAHVWKADGVGIGGAGGVSSTPGFSSEESAAGESSEEDRTFTAANVSNVNTSNVVSRTPMVVLSPTAAGMAGGNVNANANANMATSSQSVIIGCQWMDNELAVTAGWDRLANLYNVETGSLLQTLAGHDAELTHVACHPTQRLVATCSADTTFRLWDFRETIHSVSVFQGHTESVTCAAFSRSDQIVSGSDDRSVKVWDLRNMRAPVTSIHTPSAVNRLAVSQSGMIAIPHDNRQVVLYDLSGQKLLRLSRDKSHHRMVTATVWANGAGADNSEQWRTKANLFSAGFDRMAFGWSVKSAHKEDGGPKTKEKGKGDSTF